MGNDTIQSDTDSDMTEKVSRRRFLQASSVTTVGLVAGCSGVGGDGDGGSGGNGSDGSDSGDGGDGSGGSNGGDGGDSDGSIDYPTDDITHIIPFKEGTSFEAYARTFSSIWAENLGDDVNIVIENVEGGRGVRGMNQLYNAGDHTVGTVHAVQFAQNQLFQDVEYELTEFSYLGRFHRSTMTLVTRPDTYQSFDEVRNSGETVTFGTESVSSSGGLAVRLMQNTLDMDAELVTGYEGGAGTLTPIVQGELDAAVVTASTARSFLDSGDLHALLAFASSDTLPEFLPSDITTTEEIEELQGMKDVVNLQRLVAAPPDIDDEIHTLLADTLWEALQSEEYEEGIREQELSLEGRAPAEDIQDVPQNMLDLLSEHQDLFQD